MESTTIDPNRFPLEISVGTTGIILRFNSHDEIANWAERQSESWKPLEQLISYDEPAAKNAVMQFRAFFENLKTYANSLSPIKSDNPNFAKHTQRLTQSLATLQQGKRLPTESVEGQAILNDLPINPGRALGRFLVRHADLSPQGNSPVTLARFVEYVVDAKTAGLSLTGEQEAQVAALTMIKQEWDRKFQNHENSLANLQARGEAELHKRSGNLENAWKELEAAKKDHIETKTRIESAFKKEMELRAPATYWSERAVNSRWVAFFAACAFVGLASAMIYLIANLGPQILDHLRSKDGTITVGGIVVITVPSLVGFWVLKLFSRIFINNLNSARDASFRGTLIRTFLALTVEKDATMKDGDRTLILHSIFRPENAESSDDSPPVNFLDMIASEAKKSRH